MPSLSRVAAARYALAASPEIADWYLVEDHGGEGPTLTQEQVDNWTYADGQTFGLDAPGELIAQIVADAVNAGLLTETEDEQGNPRYQVTSPAAVQGRRGGLTKSEARAAASRANGKLGGRPRKSRDE